MPKTYKTPGVYVEEIPLFPPSIAAVETAIPAFIGYTQKALKGEDDLTLKPTRITSLLEYKNYFGEAEKEGSSITITINETTNGQAAPNTKVLERIVTGNITGASPHNMYYSVQAFYANGGGPCYIVSIDSTENAAGVIDDALLVTGIETLEKEDEVTLFVVPEIASQGVAKVASVMTTALDQCGKLQDRFAIIDVTDDSTDTVYNVSAAFRNESLPLENLKYGAAYYPNVKTTFNYYYDEDAVVVNHTVDGKNTKKVMSDFKPDPGTPGSGNAILYALTKSAVQDLEMELPPSPLVAGIYASVDNSRGVWKAPANVALRQVLRPSRRVTHDEQEGLNVDTSGKSINAIRSFVGKGTLIWGARTLDGNDNEWRYVPVRRFFNFAEESIKKGTERFVFEPNDANTWTKVKAMIENFLILQWRAGALAGAVPEQAFFVKVGLGQTMTALDILEGRMNVEIGMAVVRPAEFIILKFSHKMQES